MRNAQANPSLLRCHRPHRQRLRPLQVRRRRPKGLRRAQRPLVRRPPHLLRAEPRDRLSRGLLPPQLGRRVHARRLLQLYPPQEPERRARPRPHPQHQKVAALPRPRRKERQPLADAGTLATTVVRNIWGCVCEGRMWLVGL